MKDKLNLVLVGADKFNKGFGSRAHIPAIKALEKYYNFYGICTTKESSSKKLKEIHKTEKSYGNIDELVEDKNVDSYEVRGCRGVNAILRYFGDEEETLAGCGICDVCTGEEADDERDPEQVTLIVRKALSGVARVHGRFGLGAAVALLHGDRDERLSRSRIDRSSTHGILAAFPLAWLQRLLRRTVTAGWVDFTGGQRPVVVLTESGRAVMHGERAARIRLPPLGGEGSADESEAASSAPGRRRRGAAAGVPSAEELDPAALAITMACPSDERRSTLAELLPDAFAP